jgi:triosephosphate isomerase
MVAGNWKMHKTGGQGAILTQNLEYPVRDIKGAVEVVVAPPFTALQSVSSSIEFDKSPVKLAAQTMHWEDEGAYTGEVSPVMLTNLRVDYVILGHSERREYCAETDVTVNRKVRAALSHKLRPLVCCGESLATREGGGATAFVERQIREGLAGLDARDAEQLVIAYEPIWAIGTGRTATPAQAQEMCKHIRATLAALFGPAVAGDIRILYGGSVKPENAALFFGQPDVDGALVGGASLAVETFMPIVTAAIPAA